MQRFKLLLADPPWQVGAKSDKWRAQAESHYGTMTIADLKALGDLIRPIVSADAYLALWVARRQQPEAFEVAKSWGFPHFSTKMYWTKTAGSVDTDDLRPAYLMGQYGGSATEELWIFKRGTPPVVRTTDTDTYWGPVGAASAKPDEFYERFEREYHTKRGADSWPTPRLELFARTHRAWTQSELDAARAQGTSLPPFAALRFPRPAWTQVGDEFSPDDGMPAGEDIRDSLKKLQETLASEE